MEFHKLFSFFPHCIQVELPVQNLPIWFPYFHSGKDCPISNYIVWDLLSVDDFVLVEIDKRINNLLEIVHNFHLNKSLSSLDKFIESLIWTNLQQDVDIFMIFEDMFKSHNVIVAQRLVNLNFSYQLNYQLTTFCLALDLLRELLAIIFAADIFFV